MNNVVFMLVILGVGTLIGINLILLMAAWSQLTNYIDGKSTSMILIYTASIISYVVLSTMLILLIIGLILYLVGYGKADQSVIQYLVRIGYSETDAVKIANEIGPEGLLFYNDTMTKDINNANSLRFQFNGAGESFKSIMILIYTIALALMFIMGLVALILINSAEVPNNSGYGLLISSVVVSGLSLLVLGVIYFVMMRTSHKRLDKVSEDQAHLSSILKESSIDTTKLVY